jgi:hypothetical protein
MYNAVRAAEYADNADDADTEAEGQLHGPGAGPEDGRRYELFDGEVHVVPSPLPRHQIISENVAMLLRSYVATHGGTYLTAPIDIVFAEYDVLVPDLVFFVEARKHLVLLDAPIRHPPDLAIEILSPSTAAKGSRPEDAGVRAPRCTRILDRRPRRRTASSPWRKGKHAKKGTVTFFCKPESRRKR